MEHLGLRKHLYSDAPSFPDQSKTEVAQSNEGRMRLFDVEQDFHISPTRQERRKPIEAALFGQIVFIDEGFPLERQRFSTCHEIGHYCLPWHEELTFLRDGCIVEPPEAKWYELEAHQFAADLLMPPPFFREDMDSLPFGLESVERLSRRYLTSLEATARQYVDLSLRSCALMILEASPNGTTTKDGASLKIRCSHRSHTFKHFISRSTVVGPGTPLTQATQSGPGTIVTGEIAGWALGLGADRRLILHCRSWGKEGDVLALVEEPQGNQGRLI